MYLMHPALNIKVSSFTRISKKLQFSNMKACKLNPCLHREDEENKLKDFYSRVIIFYSSSSRVLMIEGKEVLSLILTSSVVLSSYN